MDNSNNSYNNNNQNNETDEHYHQQELLQRTNETLETNITISEQNISIAEELLQSMKEANESLIRTTEKIASMEQTLDVNDRMVESQWKRTKCNIIFYSLLAMGFLIVGLYALCKFYFKIDFFQ